MANTNRKTLIRIVVPIALAAIGVWLLVGCIYLPIPEHRVGSEKDFRDLVGPPNSKNPIRAGAITRSTVIAILGPPHYVSANGNAIGYTMKTEAGFEIWPLCFSANVVETHVYGVRLIFDNEILVSWQIERANGYDGGYFQVTGQPTQWDAIDALNRTGPKLSPAGK